MITSSSSLRENGGSRNICIPVICSSTSDGCSEIVSRKRMYRAQTSPEPGILLVALWNSLRRDSSSTSPPFCEESQYFMSNAQPRKLAMRSMYPIQNDRKAASASVSPEIVRSIGGGREMLVTNKHTAIGRQRDYEPKLCGSLH